MLSTLRDRLSRFQQRLTRLDNQPLGKAALAVILFLDLFILISIFDGLADHGRQLASPDQAIPPLCRDIVIDANWNATNRLDRLGQIVVRYRDSHLEPDRKRDALPVHPGCAPIVQAVRAIRDNEGLARDFQELRRLNNEIRDLRAELARSKDSYDTALLETIAGQKPPADRRDALRRQTAEKTDALNTQLRAQQTLAARLDADARVQTLFTLTDAVTESERNALRTEWRHLNFWYPVQRLGMDLLFLLPLLAAFYWWNARSIGANRPFQSLVSAHLLVVATIPVIFKLLELVYDILPRKLLKQVIDLLESIKLVAIWYYLVIAVIIVVALALIYLFQKKLFSRAKLLRRRISRGQCQECGVHLPAGSRFCFDCGAAQFRNCERCHEPTPVHGRYCRSCGHSSA